MQWPETDADMAVEEKILAEYEAARPAVKKKKHKSGPKKPRDLKRRPMIPGESQWARRQRLVVENFLAGTLKPGAPGTEENRRRIIARYLQSRGIAPPAQPTSV